jgi:hypothetical protein
MICEIYETENDEKLAQKINRKEMHKLINKVDLPSSLNT